MQTQAHRHRQRDREANRQPQRDRLTTMIACNATCDKNR